MAKKCSTDQRFCRERNTTFEIHTLVFGYFEKTVVHTRTEKFCEKYISISNLNILKNFENISV
jgi:hypothetical protein